MNAREVASARHLWARLALGPQFHPVRRFGNASAYGKIFHTSGNKLMKLMVWSPNSEREMRIAKIAGNKNVGPRVYNTRIWKPKNLGDYAILQNVFPKRKSDKVAVITMDKIPRAKSLYNAINNGNITNFGQIENVVRRMHAAGIHHGNLHGGNILVYVTNSGNLKLVPINFGASKYNKRITNASSAVRYATQVGGLRGTGTVHRVQGFTVYKRPGREQPVRSNENMLKNLRKYFNAIQLSRASKTN